MFEVFGLGAEFIFNSSGTERIVQAVDQLERLRITASNSVSDMQNFNNALAEFSGSMMNAGATMMAKGLAQTMTAMHGINDAAKWQSQMVNAVRYFADDSAEAQTAYNKQLSDTAKLLGKTKEEINESAVAYMMMGKNQTTALQLAKNAGYAAVAWDMSAGQVADAFRTIKAAFNVDLEDQSMYQRYLDTINEVGNSTAATAADVVEFLSDGGSALHNVANVSIEEAMGMASAARFANMSIAEFSTMTTRLGNQYNSGKLDEYFNKLGVETKEADGSMRSLAAALGDVQQQWTGLDQATKADFASGVGGVFADRLSLYMGSAEEYQKGASIAKQDNSGSAEAEFTRVTDTYEMAVSRMKVTIDDFKNAFWGTLLPPLTKFINIVTTIIDKISGFMQAHPAIMKLVSGFILLSGVAMTLGGALLFIGGLVVKFGTALSGPYNPAVLLTKAISGLKIALGSMAGPTKLALKNFAKLTVTMGILYASWKYDLFGIRTSLTDFVEKMQHTFKRTKEMLSDGMPVDTFQQQIRQMSASESLWDKLALAMTRVGMVIKGVGRAWNDFTLSDSMYQKLQAAGVLDTVTFILLLKMRLDALFEGIRTGFSNTMQKMTDFVQTVLRPPFEFLLNNLIRPLANAVLGTGNVIERFCGQANAGMSQDVLDRWRAFGEIIGSFMAFGLAASSIAKVVGIISKISTVMSGLGGIVGGIGTALSTVWGLISPILGSVATALGTILTTIGAIVGLPAWAVGLIAVAIAGAVALIIHYRDEIVGWISGLVSFIQPGIDLVVTVLRLAGNTIAAVFSPIFGVIKTLWTTFVGWLVTLWNITVRNFQSIWGHITGFLSTIVDGALSLWDTFVAGITSIRDTIVTAFTPALDGISTFATAVYNFLQPVIDFLAPIWDIFVTATGVAWNAVYSVIAGVLSTMYAIVAGVLTTIVNTVIDIGSAIVNTVVGVVSAVFNTVVGIVNGIIQFVGGALTLVFGTISNVFMAIYSFITGNTGAAKQYLLNAWTAIKTGVSGILRGIWTVISSIFSGILNTIISIGSGIFDAIKAPFVNAYESLLGFVENFREIGTKIITTIVSGINAAKDRIYNTIKGAFNKASSLLPHSDAPEGPFSTLTKSGMSIPSTIAAGIASKSDVLYDTMNAVGTDAMSALPNGTMDIGVNGYVNKLNTSVLDKPMSAQLTETQNLVDTRAGTYYEAVLVRLDLLVSAVGGSADATVSDAYKQVNYERVSRIQDAVAEQKASAEYNLNIQPGAIVISPQVQGNADAEEMANLIREMMESEIFPYIMNEFQRLKELKNTRG